MQQSFAARSASIPSRELSSHLKRADVPGPSFQTVGSHCGFAEMSEEVAVMKTRASKA